jgi:hypothetical protein
MLFVLLGVLGALGVLVVLLEEYRPVAFEAVYKA